MKGMLYLVFFNKEDRDKYVYLKFICFYFRYDFNVFGYQFYQLINVLRFKFKKKYIEN